MKFVLAAALLGLFLPRAEAQEFYITGVQLMKACTGSAPNDRPACDGFLAGAMDQVLANPDLKGKLCIPAGTRLGALRDSLDKFARNRPDGAKGPAIELVDQMVRLTYPCQVR